MSTQIQRVLEGKIDFEGQRLADQITRYVLIAATVVSFFAGVIAQSLRISFGVFSFAVLVLALTVVPPWPLFNRHPVKWLPVRQASKKAR
ncbi:microsomal signal peptidase subunit [Gautieria morchelliformis]|nr:microsomal signal peptidase subunit [Gautieria morchelliformis]